MLGAMARNWLFGSVLRGGRDGLRHGSSPLKWGEPGENHGMKLKVARLARFERATT